MTDIVQLVAEASPFRLKTLDSSSESWFQIVEEQADGAYRELCRSSSLAGTIKVYNGLVKDWFNHQLY